MPDEIDEEASLDTKEILSYSWRGLKEARYVQTYPANRMRLTISASCYVPLYLKLRSELRHMIFSPSKLLNDSVSYASLNF